MTAPLPEEERIRNAEVGRQLERWLREQGFDGSLYRTLVKTLTPKKRRRSKRAKKK